MSQVACAQTLDAFDSRFAVCLKVRVSPHPSRLLAVQATSHPAHEVEPERTDAASAGDHAGCLEAVGQVSG
jgi:hypothetical protein